MQTFLNDLKIILDMHMNISSTEYDIYSWGVTIHYTENRINANKIGRKSISLNTVMGELLYFL